MYKNRNKKYNLKKSHYGTSNNSTSKVKKSYNERNKETKSKDNSNYNNKTRYKIINMPLIDVKRNNIINKFSMHRNNLQITTNNFLRNKTNAKDKKGKDNNKMHALTNANINNVGINSYIYNNSANNSLSKLKMKKQKLKKLYLRNLKIYTQQTKEKDKSPLSNTIDTNTNKNDYINNIQKSKLNFTRLLTYRDAKFKKYLLNGNIINLKNFNSYRFIKPNNTQINYDPFASKTNKLMKEKKISSTNSFSNKYKNINHNNSKKEKKNIKNKLSNFILLNKKLSNGNLIRNLVLSQFHSKKEIVHKPNNITHHKMLSSLNKQNNKNRNNSLLKSKKRNFTGISNKRLNESLSIKPYKKENKINLNFNFNINFNIDINKKRKYMNSHKNNIGFLTQRNPIIKANKINKSKSKGGENLHKKNMFNSLIRNMKYDYNLRTKK